MSKVLRPSPARHRAEMLLLSGGLLLIVTGAYLALSSAQVLDGPCRSENIQAYLCRLNEIFLVFFLAMVIAGAALVLGWTAVRAHRQ